MKTGIAVLLIAVNGIPSLCKLNVQGPVLNNSLPINTQN